MLSSDLKFVNDVLLCDLIEQVWNLHVAKMLEFGFDRMIYGSNRFLTHGNFADPADAIILSSHDQAYIDLFFGEQLFLNAPMAIWAAQNTGVCSWQWAEDRRLRGETTDNENRILHINAKQGVVAGYSISFPRSLKHSKSAIGLCAKRGMTQRDVDKMWAQDGDRITVFNRVVNEKIMSLPYEKQYKKLTDRQREVLKWVADGKSIQDVATIMGLKQATIEKHLRLARENLNADTTAQAVLNASLQNQFFIVEGGGCI